jgi:hypothetical protein
VKPSVGVSSAARRVYLERNHGDAVLFLMNARGPLLKAPTFMLVPG